MGFVGKENGEAEEINILNSFMFRIPYHILLRQPDEGECDGQNMWQGLDRNIHIEF